jgi:hypothetical protein
MASREQPTQQVRTQAPPRRRTGAECHQFGAIAQSGPHERQHRKHQDQRPGEKTRQHQRHRINLPNGQNRPQQVHRHNGAGGMEAPPLFGPYPGARG